MKQAHASKYITVAFILAAGMALSGYLLSFTIYRSQVANDIISVKGLAEKEVEADWAQVPIYFSRSIMLSKQEYDETGQQNTMFEHAAAITEKYFDNTGSNIPLKKRRLLMFDEL